MSVGRYGNRRLIPENARIDAGVAGRCFPTDRAGFALRADQGENKGLANAIAQGHRMPDLSSPDTRPADPAPPTVPVGVGPLSVLLAQLAELISQLDPEQYNAKPDSTRCGAIGGHVRHTLDHVIAWLHGVNGESINYDDRQRGTDVETNPRTAELVVAKCLAQLEAVPVEVLPRTVAVFTSMTSDGALVRLPSTHARELAFVFSHTIHHNAIIGTIARALSVELPEQFGMAPSTIAYRDRDGCAQ